VLPGLGAEPHRINDRNGRDIGSDIGIRAASPPGAG
jgi:hypothetical protein